MYLLKDSTNSTTAELSPPPILLHEYINLTTVFNETDFSIPRDIITLIANSYKELEITPEQASKMIDIVKALDVLSE